MKRTFATLATALVLGALVSSSFAQDPGLGRGRGKGGGGGSGGGSGPSRPSNPPRRSDPPARTSPPTRSDPPRQNPPSNGGGLDRGRDRSPGNSGGSSGGGSFPQPSGGGRGDSGLGRGGNSRGSGGVIMPGGTVGSSRSGQVRYGTVNNGNTGRFRIPNTPSRVVIGGLSNRVYRTEQIGVVNGYRIGYRHYNRTWRDDYFNYPYYSFSPFGYSCVSSPFYGYAFLPPYLAFNRVIVVTGYTPTWGWNYGTAVNWSNSYYGWGGNGYNQGQQDQRDRQAYQAARDAVSDLADAFDDGDPRLASRLVPRDGSIAILRDGQYDYSIGPNDFDDMLRDLVSNARTLDYRIIDSREYRNSVRVVARHEYNDPWGQRQVMYHHILLEPERSSYVIREFGTSYDRYW